MMSTEGGGGDGGMESGPSGAGGVQSSGSSTVGEGLLQGGDLNDEYFSETIFNQLEGMQDYLPLEEFGTSGGWTSQDYLPLLGGDGSFDSGVLPPALKGKERSSSNDMDHEASDLSSLDDGGEESGHEHDVPDGTAPPPSAAQPRKKSKSEADKTKARNREHARNTRLRKKAYIETLRQTLQSLTDERDHSERNMKLSMARAVEQQSVRKQVLQNFFIHRARGELDRRKWSTILDENCFMRLPVTPYRYFPASEVVDNSRHVQGLDGIIRDTASLQVMAESLGRTPTGKVQIQFFAEADHVIISGSSLMCRWLMKTDNAVRCGGAMELHFYGMLHVEFGMDRKITKLVFVFDVMGFMQQLRRCSGRQRVQVAPSTLQLAEEPSDEARLIVSIQSSLKIQSLNQAWLNTFGVGPQDCQGKGLVVECPPVVEQYGQASTAHAEVKQAVSQLYECLSRRLPWSIVVVYFPNGQAGVYARLRMFPLLAGGQLMHYMAALEPLTGQEGGGGTPGPLPMLVLR